MFSMHLKSVWIVFFCQCSEHMMFVLTGALKLWGARVSKCDRLGFKTQPTRLHFISVSSSAVQHVHIFHYEILTAEFIVWKAPQGQGIWRTCGWFPCGGLKRGSLCDESCCLEMSSLSTERRVIWSWSSDLLTLVYSSLTYLDCWCLGSDVCQSTLYAVCTLGSIQVAFTFYCCIFSVLCGTF